MLRTILILLFLPLFSLGQIPKPKPNNYINDYTNSLSTTEIYNLNERLSEIEQKSTIQVAIILIDKIPEKMSIEEFARELGNNWKVGIAFNGIVYVAALNERKQRLEIAKNLEGTIPDITALQIIESLKP